MLSRSDRILRLELNFKFNKQTTLFFYNLLDILNINVLFEALRIFMSEDENQFIGNAKTYRFCTSINCIILVMVFQYFFVVD